MGTDGEAANWDENALKSVMANVHLGLSALELSCCTHYLAEYIYL